jgi:hypothetical protein
MREYMRTYIKANNESINCTICGGKYKSYLKYVHDNGVKHKKELQIKNLENIINKIKSPVVFYKI